MTNQGCRIVLWNPCPFTLGDEPLACGVEHGASQVWIGYAEFCIRLHYLVHGEGWKQPALLWQGSIQKLLQLGVQWDLPLCCLGLQLSISLGWIWMNRPKFPLLMTSVASSPQISPERIPVSRPKRRALESTLSLACSSVTTCSSVRTL